MFIGMYFYFFVVVFFPPICAPCPPLHYHTQLPLRSMPLHPDILQLPVTSAMTTQVKPAYTL